MMLKERQANYFLLILNILDKTPTAGTGYSPTLSLHCSDLVRENSDHGVLFHRSFVYKDYIRRALSYGGFPIAVFSNSGLYVGYIFMAVECNLGLFLHGRVCL